MHFFLVFIFNVILCIVSANRQKRFGVPFEVELECAPAEYGGNNATFAADPSDCGVFYMCEFGWPKIQFCPEGTFWSQTQPDEGRCENPENTQNDVCGFTYDSSRKGKEEIPRTGDCEIYCYGSHSECIAYTEICDGFPQCNDGSDERDCALPCEPRSCRLPDCHCSSTEIPGDLLPSEIPQLVLMTFEGAARIEDYQHLYSQIFNKVGRNRRRTPRKNPNGCRIGATFFNIHQFTEYVILEMLYKQGVEIATLSLSHRQPSTYWRDASEQTWTGEMAGQRQTMALFSKVLPSRVLGMRAPYLQMGGNRQFAMMKNNGFLWDNSWPTQQMYPPLWPYTLDYRSTQECVVPPCPTASFPSMWEVPMVDYLDTNSTVCNNVDGCHFPEDKEEALQLLRTNFYRHYESNRAPFPLHLRPRWFHEGHYNLEALQDFIDELQKKGDVWFVTVSQSLSWIRNPTPIGHDLYDIFNCDDVRDFEKVCEHPLRCEYHNVTFHPNSESHPGDRTFHTCAQYCPNRYPYTGNPVGL